MGQGAPETGPIPGAPARNFFQFPNGTIPDDDMEYAPVTGLHELRQKVADYYNHLYRQNHDSKYAADNVCIVPGGRAGITRVMSILGNVQCGHFNVDYTAYEQALGLYHRICPSPMLHRDVNEAVMGDKEFDFQLGGRGISEHLPSVHLLPSISVFVRSHVLLFLFFLLVPYRCRRFVVFQPSQSYGSVGGRTIVGILRKHRSQATMQYYL